MIALILLGVTLSVLLFVVFVLGVTVGLDESRDELARVRLEAARASRQLHDLTRQAFVAMTEEAEQRRLRR